MLPQNFACGIRRLTKRLAEKLEPISSMPKKVQGRDLRFCQMLGGARNPHDRLWKRRLLRLQPPD